VFFALNSTVAGSLFIGGVYSILSATTDIDVLCGLLLGFFGGGYGTLELYAFWGRSRAVERGLGYANLLTAVLLAFGVAADTCEIVFRGKSISSMLLLVFIPACAFVVAYLAICGRYRLKATRRRRVTSSDLRRLRELA